MYRFQRKIQLLIRKTLWILIPYTSPTPITSSPFPTRPPPVHSDPKLTAWISAWERYSLTAGGLKEGVKRWSTVQRKSLWPTEQQTETRCGTTPLRNNDGSFDYQHAFTSCQGYTISPTHFVLLSQGVQRLIARSGLFRSFEIRDQSCFSRSGGKLGWTRGVEDWDLERREGGGRGWEGRGTKEGWMSESREVLFFIIKYQIVVHFITRIESFSALPAQQLAALPLGALALRPHSPLLQQPLRVSRQALGLADQLGNGETACERAFVREGVYARVHVLGNAAHGQNLEQVDAQGPRVDFPKIFWSYFACLQVFQKLRRQVLHTTAEQLLSAWQLLPAKLYPVDHELSKHKGLWTGQNYNLSQLEVSYDQEYVGIEQFCVDNFLVPEKLEEAQKRVYEKIKPLLVQGLGLIVKAHSYYLLLVYDLPSGLGHQIQQGLSLDFRVDQIAEAVYLRVFNQRQQCLGALPEGAVLGLEPASSAEELGEAELLVVGESEVLLASDLEDEGTAEEVVGAVDVVVPALPDLLGD